MTTLAHELDELAARWHPLPGQAPARWPVELVHTEFASPDDLERLRRKLVGAMLQYAAETVPWYMKRLRRAGVGPDYTAADALSKVPILTREVLQEHAQALRTTRLPPGEEIVVKTMSSGTSGQPTSVVHSKAGRIRQRMIQQRQLRWYRYDPMQKRAAIRPFSDLPRLPSGQFPGPGEVARQPAWPGVEHFFRSGPFVGFANTNPIEAQVDFVLRERPRYLLMQAAGLEHLAFAFAERERPVGLAACEAISQTLTPSMRRAIEGTFGVPVHQNYGLNEVGLVATKCPEGGRYHVHSEQCVVEIVDADGRPVRPGEQGRLLVTLLTNAAMPILRYDADDLATAVEGPCPCGRTLPTFGEVIGRYRRIAQLPPGSWARWGAIQLALYELPPDLGRALRKYQAVQSADGAWELRLHTAGDEAPAIGEFVRGYFVRAVDGEPPPLRVLGTDRFLGDPRGKFQSFVSDFVPALDTERSP